MNQNSQNTWYIAVVRFVRSSANAEAFISGAVLSWMALFIASFQTLV